MAQKIAIGSDHGGFSLKEDIIRHLHSLNVEVIDCGTLNKLEKADYPDIAAVVCGKILKNEVVKGILICGTGIGISMAANKFDGIRCGLCHDHYTAKMCREHNDANVLSIGGRTTGVEVAKEIVSVFLDTAFAGGHHTARVEKLNPAYLGTKI